MSIVERYREVWNLKFRISGTKMEWMKCNFSKTMGKDKHIIYVNGQEICQNDLFTILA